MKFLWRKDGSCFPVEYVSTPIRDDNGDLVGAVVTFKDVSDRKRTGDELKKANIFLDSVFENHS